jgi:ankyrin repeat protein
VGINRKDTFGIAAIHVAAHNGSMDLITLLLANGADPYLRTDEGLSLIHLAAEGDAVNAIYHFNKKFNIGIDEKDEKGSTPLHWAVFEG